jgi:hypothetical protein
MTASPLHLVQLKESSTRRVAFVQEHELVLLADFDSIYGIAQAAMVQGGNISAIVNENLTSESLGYDDIYEGRSQWKLLPPIDVPGDPHRVLVSGTGLTHYGSARDRQAMHANTLSAQEQDKMTDSMRMFEWGRQHGRPAMDSIGIAPEWFYKGSGTVLRTHGDDLEIPGYAEDGGEEAEIAAIYVNDPTGTPVRLGMCNGNEFSDHVFERRNYLNLAGSKLRVCSIGPELVINPPFEDVPGAVRILRDGAPIWDTEIRTGEANMCHSLANLEHHHFKFEDHRQPGQVHVHFMGADTLSFGEGLCLKSGDSVEVAFSGFGRPLRNQITAQRALEKPLGVSVLK